MHARNMCIYIGMNRECLYRLNWLPGERIGLSEDRLAKELMINTRTSILKPLMDETSVPKIVDDLTGDRRIRQVTFTFFSP